MPDRNEPAADASQPRHLFPRARKEEDQDQDTSFNPYVEEGEFQTSRRGVGDDVADPGLVEPYGHLEREDDFHLDEHIWVCGSCGYQTGGLEDPEGVCPNCSAQGEFVIQHM